MGKSDKNISLKLKDLHDVVGGKRPGPGPSGTKDWHQFAIIWYFEYASLLDTIPERYAELDEAVRALSYINIERIVYKLMETEPADGPVIKIYNDPRFYNN